MSVVRIDIDGGEGTYNSDGYSQSQCYSLPSIRLSSLTNNALDWSGYDVAFLGRLTMLWFIVVLPPFTFFYVISTTIPHQRLRGFKKLQSENLGELSKGNGKA